MADELKIFQPNKYYSIFIDNSIRPDGRKLSSFRSTSINVGCISTANGSALVKLRETTVLCGIKAELTNPLPDEPNKGFIIPNVDFPSVCSSRFNPGPPTEQAQVYSQLISDVLQNSLFISPEDLCIVEGKLCWCLYADITCLNFGGNVLDACVLALLAAAKNTSLPEVLTRDDPIQVTENKISLNVKNLPFSSTFAVFENGVVTDPTIEEETLASGLVTIFVREDGTICNIHMPRGCILSETRLQHCIQLSKKRSKKLALLIENLPTKDTN